MPRTMRVQYQGAIYHVMDRGDRQENIFVDDVDRQSRRRGIKTLAEACQKTGWQVHAYCLIRQKILELMDGKLGENHSGELHRETAGQKANRIISEEMSPLGWKETDLARRLKNDPGKLAIAARVRRETTLPIKWIAARVQLDSSKSVKSMLHYWMHAHEKSANNEPQCAQLQFQPTV